MSVCQSPTLFFFPYFMTPPHHLCITSTVSYLKLTTLVFFLFFSLLLFLDSLSLSWDDWMSKHTHTHTHTHTRTHTHTEHRNRDERSVQMNTMSRKCAWTWHTQTTCSKGKHAEWSYINTGKAPLHLSLIHTNSDTHTTHKQEEPADSPVFGDVCSAVLKIGGSSRGSGPERGGTPSKRRVYWGREGTTNSTGHFTQQLPRHAD